MRIAVTGAAGFIGGRVVLDALQAGHEVVAQLRPSHDGAALEAAGASLLRADLGSSPEPPFGEASTLVAGLDGVDAVIHCAARVRWGSKEEFHRDTVLGTEELLAAATAAGVGRVVHVSTTAVYGDRAVELGPLDESAPFGRKMSSWDRYARAKIAAEERVQRLQGRGPEAVVIRPGWVVGRGDSNVSALLDGLRGPAFPLVGRGDNRLPITWVGSVSAACLLAAESPEAEGAYNVACEWELTQRDFLMGLAEAAGVRARLLPLPFRLFYTAGFAAEAAARVLPGLEPPLSRSVAVLLGRDAVIRTDRIRRLGWRPTPLADFLRSLAG